MPPASATLRLLAFAVPAGLALSSVQPLIAALAHGVPADWALSLSAPALLVALVVVLTDRLSDREGSPPGEWGDSPLMRAGQSPSPRIPPWYSAWALLPGAFLLAGAASMCIFGALIQLPAVRAVECALLVAGGLTWAAALVWVRSRSGGSSSA